MALNATIFGASFRSNGVLWVVGTINLWKSQEPTPIWEKSGQVKPKEEDVESHATQCGWFFWNIFDETANCVMYEVQNFLSATSIFVEKFLLNIFAAAVGILCQKFVNFNRFKLYHPKVVFWEIETPWKHLNCFIRGNANLKLHLRACWRGQDQRESEVQGNSSMLSRLLQKSFWWKSSNCKNPKKVVQMKPRKCECTPHIWEQRRWMTTSKEWWCDIFLAKQWFWRGFQDFRKWQFE